MGSLVRRRKGGTRPGCGRLAPPGLAQPSPAAWATAVRRLLSTCLGCDLCVLILLLACNPSMCMCWLFASAFCGCKRELGAPACLQL